MSPQTDDPNDRPRTAEIHIATVEETIDETSENLSPMKRPVAGSGGRPPIPPSARPINPSINRR